MDVVGFFDLKEDFPIALPMIYNSAIALSK
jgi:hypothetical protein